MTSSPLKERPRPPNIRASSPIEVPRAAEAGAGPAASSSGASSGADGGSSSSEKARTMSSSSGGRPPSPSGGEGSKSSSKPPSPKTQLLNSVMGALEAFDSDKEQSSKEDGDGSSSGANARGGPGLPRPPLNFIAKWQNRYNSMSDSDDGMEREERRLSDQVRALNRRLSKSVPWPLTGRNTGGGGTSTFNGEPATPPGGNPLFVHPVLSENPDAYGLGEALATHYEYSHRPTGSNLSIGSSSGDSRLFGEVLDAFAAASRGIHPDSPDIHGDHAGAELGFDPAVSVVSGGPDATAQGDQQEEQGRGRRRAGSRSTVSSLGNGGNSPVPYVGAANLGGTLEQRQQQKRGMSVDGSLELSKSGSLNASVSKKQARGSSVDGMGNGANRAAGSNNNADSNKQGNATNNPLYAQSPMVVLEPIHLENAILKAVELGRTSGTSSSSCSAPAPAAAAAAAGISFGGVTVNPSSKQVDPSSPELSEDELLALLPPRLSRKKMCILGGIVFTILAFGAIGGFIAAQVMEHRARTDAEGMRRRVLVGVRPIDIVGDAIDDGHARGKSSSLGGAKAFGSAVDPCADIPLVKIFWGRLNRTIKKEREAIKRRMENRKRAKIPFPFDV